MNCASTSTPTSSDNNGQATKPQAPSKFPYSGNGKLDDPFNISLKKNLKLDENIRGLICRSRKQVATASQVSLYHKVYMLLSSRKIMASWSKSVAQLICFKYYSRSRSRRTRWSNNRFPPIYEPIPLATMTIAEVK